jgi:ABC-2 type transport system ATP-binding protein
VWAAVDELHQEGTTVLLVTHELDEAEVLCDRVIAMRGGTVLDQGSPADLMARHAPWAVIRFGWPTRDGADLEEAVRRLPGVRDVHVAEDRVDVHGDRRSIAHVGAELVRRGSVPTDFSVELPDLESALLELLSRPQPTTAIDRRDADPSGLLLTGAHR